MSVVGVGDAISLGRLFDSDGQKRVGGEKRLEEDFTQRLTDVRNRRRGALEIKRLLQGTQNTPSGTDWGENRKTGNGKLDDDNPTNI